MDVTTALAASRLVAQQRAMDITANNIANANTPGFRTERVQFSDFVDRQRGTAAVPGGRSLTYTQDRATYRESQPGTVSHTDTRVTIAGDGTVSTENGQVGKIGVVQPADAMKLRAEGATHFISDSPTAPVKSPGIVQGAVEESNVQPVMEMTRMMNDVRQFQFVTQFIQAEGDRQQSAIDKILPTGSNS
jgi:flagellar basal-body rod protein FlgF